LPPHRHCEELVQITTCGSCPQVLDMLPACLCISWACTFRAGNDASNFSVSPSKQKENLMLLRRAGSSGISWCILSLVKMNLNRHYADFEPQRASPFRKWVKAPRVLGEAARMAPLFMIPFGLLVLLANSYCGDHHFLFVSLRCSDHHLITLGTSRYGW